MEAGDIIRIIMMTAGILIMLSALWFLAGKRLTADLAAVWEIAGVMLILIGMVSRLSGWTADLSRRQELFAGCAVAAPRHTSKKNFIHFLSSTQGIASTARARAR